MAIGGQIDGLRKELEKSTADYAKLNIKHANLLRRVALAVKALEKHDCNRDCDGTAEEAYTALTGKEMPL